MREKDKLNLKTVDDLVEGSSLRSLLTIGTKGAQGAGGGLAVGGLAITFLALAGITAAFVYEMLAALTGAAVFGVLAVIVAGYQLYKEQAKIKKLKTNFDVKLHALRRSTIEALKTYESINELIETLNYEIERLRVIAQEITDSAELKRVNEKLKMLLADLEKLEETKNDVLKRIQITLGLAVGETATERLAHLYGTINGVSGKEAILNYAELTLNIYDQELRQLNSALDNIWNELDQPYAQDIKADQFKHELDILTKPDKDKTHPHMKRVNYALTGVGGFLGGVGATLTVAALIFGGMAALAVIGWPVLVAAIGIGTITMVGALLYYRYIDKKQQRTVKRLNVATGQVSGMGTYLTEKINNDVKNEVVQARTRYLEVGKETTYRLSEQENSLKEVITKIDQDVEVVKHLLSEIGHFKTYTTINKKSAAKLMKSIEENLVILRHMQSRITKIAIIACSENKKTRLLDTVEEYIDKATENLETMTKIYSKIDDALHDQHTKMLQLTEVKVEANLKMQRPNHMPALVSVNTLNIKIEEDSEGEGKKTDLQKNV